MAASKKLGTYLDSDDVPGNYKVPAKLKKLAAQKKRK